MKNQVQIILVQNRKVDRDTGQTFRDFRIAKLTGAISVSSFNDRVDRYVGDIISGTTAESLAQVTQYTVVVTEQKD